MSTDKALRTIDFVACPNPDHVKKEGWNSYSLSYSGNGTIICQTCWKEYSISDIMLEVTKDFKQREFEMLEDYQRRLAELALQEQEARVALEKNQQGIDS